MKLTQLMILGAALLVSTPVFATTYYGGFEDRAGAGSDYDYNDLVFSISGAGLTLHTATGKWTTAPSISTLNTQWGTPSTLGSPFWNNPSMDGSGGYSIGSCIYGGGACNGGQAIAAGAQYLATAKGGSVNDVYFSTTGSVAESVTLSLAGAQNVLGWELVSGVGGIHYFGTGVQSATFTATGDFILVAKTSTTGDVYTSNSTACDGVSHMAFFAATPEPSSMGLIGLAFTAAGVLFRRKK